MLSSMLNDPANCAEDQTITSLPGARCACDEGSGKSGEVAVAAPVVPEGVCEPEPGPEGEPAALLLLLLPLTERMSSGMPLAEEMESWRRRCAGKAGLLPLPLGERSEEDVRLACCASALFLAAGDTVPLPLPLPPPPPVSSETCSRTTLSIVSLRPRP